MNRETWSAVDDYLGALLLRHDAALAAALEASAAAGLPPIHVSAAHGKFLHLLARTQGARHILEIGTLGGYSTIWLARALPPQGRLVTLEIDAHHAQVARASIESAGLAHLVDLRVGRAIELLPPLAAEGLPPFDLIFIDADKPSNAAYFAWAVKLSRPGSLILVDNVVRKGGIIDPHATDPNIEGTRRFLEALAAEPGVTATVLQTVGSKGYDGLAIARVNDV